MAAPTSAVAICNLALDYLKADNVTSIESPSTTTESICARWYDASRLEAIRKYPWNFARKRGSISRDSSTTVPFGYADAYNLPNDFVRLLFIGNDAISLYRDSYQIEGSQILVNNDGGASLNIGYIFDQTDVTKFDYLFVNVLALTLAKNIAYKFTEKNTVYSRIVDLLTEAQLAAAAIDGQERPPKRIQTSKFVRARHTARGTSQITTHTDSQLLLEEGGALLLE